MLRCRAGDLAIVLKGKHIGKIVTVKRYAGESLRRHWDGSLTIDGDCWDTSDPDPSEHPDLKIRTYRDTELLPIRPGDLKETEEREKELTE